MNLTINPRDQKPKNKLVDIDVDEIALVAKGSSPVNPGATIDMVKAKKDSEVVTDADVNGFSKVFIALRKALAGETETTPELVVQKSEDETEEDNSNEESSEDENSEEENVLEKAKMPNKTNSTDKNNTKNSSSKNPANSAAAKEDAADGGVDDDEEDSSGKKMPNKTNTSEGTNTKNSSKNNPKNGSADNEDQGDGDQEDANGNNKPSKKNPRVKKSLEVSLEEFAVLANSLTNLESQIAELNKAFNDQILTGQDIEKANAGAAKAKEAQGHVANMSLEATKLLASFKEQVNNVPAEVTTTITEVETSVEKATKDDIGAQIRAAMTSIVEPVLAKLASLEAQNVEIANIAKAAQETATNAEGNAITRVTQALEKAESEVVEQARINNIPNMTDQAGTAKVEKALTREEARLMPIQDVVSQLLRTKTK